MNPLIAVQDLGRMQYDDGTLQRHAEGGQLTSRRHWWKIEAWECSLYGYGPGKAKKYLTERNFAFGKEGQSVEHIEYLCSRAQRGMISYHKCSLVELRKFCKQRGVHVSEHHNHSTDYVQKSLSKDQLRDVLEYSDEQARLPRFKELPAELRVMIYKYSFNMMHGPQNEDWRVKALDLDPPPIVSVSKLLRQESLPLLYEEAVLRIDMTKDNKYREPRNVTEFFGVAPLAIVEAVKEIQIVIFRGDIDTKNVHIWRLRFLGVKSPHHFHLARIPVKKSRKRSRFVPEDVCKKIDKALQRVLDVMKPKVAGQTAKLKRADLYLIRKAIQSTLSE